ncbi:hypothetical protein GCM10007423_49280 [Dyadobacter endophyticus]|uniref:Uncharacterized protein n=1 Tax=Dyadobacter endophyticus TaxID=1749036 RepID=A0ABQ1Z5V1_9BACT|nr:hypothetical protein [Dyadobacter endophyticus]GGH48234.1 hypothetical protein GCM10007423_49280 [Dyadobacter endophyticus]
MKKLYVAILFSTLFLAFNLFAKAQIKEPDFIGESYIIKIDSSYSKLDKSIGNFTSGMSFSSNSWNALSLEVDGGKAQTRIAPAEKIMLIVRAVDNNSDPMSIITIYKFNAKKNKRTVVVSKDNSGTVMKSRTNSKEMIKFDGSKYGSSSYILDLGHLKSGEYGVVVSNPNSKDEKRVIVSGFGVD